ncbi:LacI family DNA-binding transcriptional regulator [Paraoerskovia sediminicola]|uniref:LacI family DNA-binding transcriptional regulator n=1 Tax=Paraoerskovia sediminicola TaxID=1138587 RepID=UPI003305CDC1
MSHQTVSRVLNDHPSVRPETRDRVLVAIERLGYRRNSAARALVTRRSATIGVVTTGSALYGPTSTLVAIERAARDAGYFVGVATLTSLDAASVHTALEHFLDQAVEGVVVIAPQDDVAQAVERFSADVPLVLVAAREPDPARKAHEIAVDQRAGARAATAHLAGLGHREVLHLAGPQDWFDARERVAGWREALAAAGTEGTLRQGDWTSARGYRVGGELADQVVAGAARRRCSPRTTSSRSVCSAPSGSAVCACPSRSRSSGSTTSRGASTSSRR